MKNLFLLLLMLAIVSEMSKENEKPLEKVVYQCRISGPVHKVVCDKPMQ